MDTLSTVSNSLLLPLVTNKEKGVYQCHGQLTSGQKFISNSVIIFPEDPLPFNLVRYITTNVLHK